MTSGSLEEILRPLSTKARARVSAFAALDTSLRSMQGGVAYLMMLSYLGLSTQSYSEHPVLMWVVTPIICAVVLARLAFHGNREALYRANPVRWEQLSRAGVLAIAACCGTLYGCFLIFYGYERWSFMILVFWLTGIAAGAVITLMADLQILRLYLLLIFIPPVLVSLYLGGVKGYSCAFGLLSYFSFMNLQGHHISQIYWRQLVGREMQTERNEEVEQARHVAEEANRVKSQFLAHMSHEIRTPMHGVLGVTDLLLNTDLTAQQKQLVDVLSTSAEGLLHVINDILDLSKVEAGKLTLERIPVNVRALAQEVQLVLAARAASKRLDFRTDIDDHLPAGLLCDPVRLRQVLINLVGNAIKFTNAGHIILSVSCEPSADESSDGKDLTSVRFAVADTGIGIAPDQQKSIFDPFSQADSTVNRRFGGTGLGLAISRQIVELMGSKLEVQSQPRQGSCFSFSCKLERAVVAPAGIAPLPQVGEHRALYILVAEDNPVNQLIVKKALHAEGHSIVMVQNGREAVDTALAGNFDLVLMDNQMPELSGIEATRIIKAKRPELPIIGVSANAMEGDREECLAAGMDGYVSKPFRLQDLMSAIEECLRVKAA